MLPTAGGRSQQSIFVAAAPTLKPYLSARDDAVEKALSNWQWSCSHCHYPSSCCERLLCVLRRPRRECFQQVFGKVESSGSLEDFISISCHTVSQPLASWLSQKCPHGPQGSIFDSVALLLPATHLTGYGWVPKDMPRKPRELA